MPLAFPSHQGLLAPLWRMWPGRFSVLALWTGAMAPDIVDGVETIIIDGHFGQWIGHSLVGATALGVPLALVLAWGFRKMTRRGVSTKTRLRTEVWSAWIGVLSHVLFDLVSHSHSQLLWPFADDPTWLGKWWTSAWFTLSAPGYHEYPIGPHFVSWLVLSAAGVVMFFRWPPAKGTRDIPDQD